MSKIKTGGQAFPSAAIGENFRVNKSGMTLRDYFAAKALQGWLSSEDDTMDKYELARWCYEMADMMLFVRDEQNEF